MLFFALGVREAEVDVLDLFFLDQLQNVGSSGHGGSWSKVWGPNRMHFVCQRTHVAQVVGNRCICVATIMKARTIVVHLGRCGLDIGAYRSLMPGLPAARNNHRPARGALP